jgi:uncharacterized protein (DUF1778 family)
MISPAGALGVQELVSFFVEKVVQRAQNVITYKNKSRIRATTIAKDT